MNKDNEWMNEIFAGGNRFQSLKINNKPDFD